MNTKITIEEVLENFDFYKVRKVMKFIKMKWPDGEGELKVPSIQELEEQARNLLESSIEQVFKDKENVGYASSGGFQAICDWNSDCLSLSFNLDESEIIFKH